MKITRTADAPSRKGPPERFTGEVWQEPIVELDAPANLRALLVYFAPKSRTAWHTHPLGQTIRIESGVALVQAWDGPVLELHPGDTCYFEPNEKHWHGAAPNHHMVHLAMQEAINGEHVTWMEHVTDEQYGKTPQARS
ncbi:MAG: cupin domain-containing protein [Hyphomicrobiales bacterium]|nr:cupin domain-containing protein [Hyphomicrobiales bacterium]